MTKSNYGENATLTEQWKSGNLPTTSNDHTWISYYLRMKSGQILVAPYLWGAWRVVDHNQISEVLAPCDYNELVYLHKALNDCREKNEVFIKENTKLKELLRDLFKEVKDCNSQVHRINDCRRETTAYWQIESTKIALNRVETKIQSAISESEEQ